MQLLRRDAVVCLAAHPGAELPRVRAFHDRRVILEFEIILRVEGVPDLRAAAVKGPEYLDRGAGAVGDFLTGGAIELETRLIDGRSESGESLGSGIYFYRISTPDGSFTGRLVVLK